MSRAARALRLVRRFACLLVLLPLAACVDRELVQEERRSAEGRFRFALGDLGAARDEAASREEGVPEGARRYRVGERFLYGEDGVWTVAGMEGAVVEWEDSFGRRITGTVNPAFPPFLVWSDESEQVRQIGGDPPTALWPIGAQPRQVYNSIRVTTDHATGERRTSRHRLECDSLRSATITVALGTFHAVPITCRYFSGIRMNQTSVRTWYFVPELGHWVRYTEIDLAGRLRDEILLTGIEPAPGQIAQSARRQAGQLLRETLENRPSGSAVPWRDPGSGLSGLVMAAATFAPEPESFCRAYSLTVADAAGNVADYPGVSCREGGAWTLPGWL